MKVNRKTITHAILSSCRADTSASPEEWSYNNPAKGQCVPASLVVQDYFKGDIISYIVNVNGKAETHYANQLDGGIIIDTTISQYSGLKATKMIRSVDLKGFGSIRAKLLSDSYNRNRYELLKQRVEDSVIT